MPPDGRRLQHRRTVPSPLQAAQPPPPAPDPAPPPPALPPAPAEAAAGFFSTVCAPRFTPSGPSLDPSTVVSGLWPGLCSGCDASQSPSAFCYDNRPQFGKDKYADYSGALQCLVDGRGDVAFLKHSTPQALIPQAQQGGYRLFCPNSPSGARASAGPVGPLAVSSIPRAGLCAAREG